MNTRTFLLSFAGAAAISFVVVAGFAKIAWAADCTYVSVACPGWGAGSQQAEQTGYCCIVDKPGAVPCGSGVKAVTDLGIACGYLVPYNYAQSKCEENSIGERCGVRGGAAGCTSQECGS